MFRHPPPFIVILFLVVVISSGVFNSQSHSQNSETSGELVRLTAEIERLKTLVPDQAHAMADVDYHFTNLWFAVQKGNWNLADFYWKETLSHLRWAVRIIPVRKDSQGTEVGLSDILSSIENADHLKLGDSIAKQDRVRFEAGYRSMLESCYSCHKAVDKPYLRPRIPDKPASAIINFEPGAAWPL